MYLKLETGEIISIRNMINKFYKKPCGNQITRKFTKFTVSTFVIL